MKLIDFCNTLITFVCKQPSLQKTLLLQFAMHYLRHVLNRQIAEPLQAKKTQIAEMMRQLARESHTQSVVSMRVQSLNNTDVVESLVDKVIRLKKEQAILESIFNSKRYKLLEKTAETYFRHLKISTVRHAVLFYFLSFTFFKRLLYIYILIY